MKAISIKQPWAHLIASGIKTVENRAWYSEHRGDILICAGKSRDELERDIDYLRKAYGIFVKPEELVFGQALAVAKMIACTKSPTERIDKYWHEHGKFAWVLRQIRQIDPFPVRGKLMVFDVPFSWDEYPEQIREPLPDALELDNPARGTQWP